MLSPGVRPREVVPYEGLDHMESKFCLICIIVVTADINPCFKLFIHVKSRLEKKTDASH